MIEKCQWVNANLSINDDSHNMITAGRTVNKNTHYNKHTIGGQRADLIFAT
jgi:hypothetical protein